MKLKLRTRGVAQRAHDPQGGQLLFHGSSRDQPGMFTMLIGGKSTDLGFIAGEPGEIGHWFHPPGKADSVAIEDHRLDAEPASVKLNVPREIGRASCRERV